MNKRLIIGFLIVGLIVLSGCVTVQQEVSGSEKTSEVTGEDAKTYVVEESSVSEEGKKLIFSLYNERITEYVKKSIPIEEGGFITFEVRAYSSIDYLLTDNDDDCLKARERKTIYLDTSFLSRGELSGTGPKKIGPIYSDHICLFIKKGDPTVNSVLIQKIEIYQINE